MGKASPVVSKGYSDDTATMATTKKSAEEIHRSTLEFCAHYGLRMNAKTELRGWWNGKKLTGAMSLKIQEGALWVEQPRWVEVTEKARLTKTAGEQEVIRARPGQPFKYLGVWFDTDGTWRRQVAELQKMVGWYSSIAEVNHLTVAQSVTLFNTFLRPKLAYRLQVMGPAEGVWKKVRNLDTLLCRIDDRLSGWGRSGDPQGSSKLSDGTGTPVDKSACSLCSVCNRCTEQRRRTRRAGGERASER
jgi:hypothetical protein